MTILTAWPRAIANRILTAWYRFSHPLFAAYWRAAKPVTVGVKLIVTDPDGRVLLVKPRYHATWNLPGGGVHRRERMDEAAVREVREEAGMLINLQALRPLGMLTNRAEGKTDHIAIFHLALATPVDIECGAELDGAAFHALDALPNDTSQATRRRLAEFSADQPMTGAW